MAKQDQAKDKGKNKHVQRKPAEEQPSCERPEEEAPEAAAPCAERGENEKAETAAAPVEWLVEKEDLINQLKRAKADLDNFRRISRLEQERIREYAQFDFFKRFLPVIDNLERAKQSACREEVPSVYREGLEMIYRQLMELLEQEGINRIEAKGCVFDPNCHHAVMQAEGGEGEPDTVAEELAPGYRYKDRILRPAMVTAYPSE